MKPVGVTYQAAIQVKVLRPEILDIIEVDVFQRTEGSMKDGVMVSHHSLYRGLRPWHDMRDGVYVNLGDLLCSRMSMLEQVKTDKNWQIV